MLSENSLDAYVTYHGIVDGEKKRDLLKLCDFFALPTRYPNEGQPISILEAMGSGMFVITTDHAGIPDIVENGVNGIVIPKDSLDVEQCFRMLSAFSREELRSNMQHNRIIAMEKYTQRKYIENLGSIFGKI